MKPHTQKFRQPSVEDWLDRVPALIPRAWDEADGDPTEAYADLAGIVRAEEGSW